MARRIIRSISLVLIGLAVTLTGWSAVYDGKTGSDESPFAAEDLDLGECAVGGKSFYICVRNRSTDSGQIIGLSEGCGKGCCWRAKLGEPGTIPPGATFLCPCEMNVSSAGPFEAGIDLHLFQNGHRLVQVTVRGIGIAARRPADERQAP